MKLNKNNKKSLLLLFILNILFCLFLYFNNSSYYKKDTYTPPSIHVDEHQYFAISMQIYKFKTITHDSPKAKGWPSNYREFIYPLYISLFYNFLDWDFDYSVCVFEKKIYECEDVYKVITFAQVFLLFLTLLSTLFFLHKKPLSFLFASSTIIFLFYHKQMFFSLRPEHLSALLLMLTSFYFQKIIFSIKSRDLIICAILFTGLIFIKNIFYYLAYIIIFIAGSILLKNFIKNFFFNNLVKTENELPLKFFAIGLIAIILVMPYQLRNTIHFDDSSLSTRGREMLTFRNELLKADYVTLTKGFYYYFPNFFGFKNQKLEKIQGKSYFWEQNPNSYYRGYTKKNGFIVNYFNKKNKTNYSGFDELQRYEKDKIMKTNVEIYLKNIVKQSYISILIFFRGINEHYGIMNNDKIQKFLFDFIYYFLTFYFLYGFIKSIKNKNLESFIFHLPTIYFIFMMSTLSTTESIMNNSLVLVLILNFFINYKKKFIKLKK